VKEPATVYHPANDNNNKILPDKGIENSDDFDLDPLKNGSASGSNDDDLPF
jgi:hypothetical protein